MAGQSRRMRWSAGTPHLFIGPNPDIGVFVNSQPIDGSVPCSFCAMGLAMLASRVCIISIRFTYAIAIAKATVIKRNHEELGGTVLEYVEYNDAETSNRHADPEPLLCLQRYVTNGLTALPINDINFDFMSPHLPRWHQGERPTETVAAGDGI